MLAPITFVFFISKVLAAPQVSSDAKTMPFEEPSYELLSEIGPKFLKEASKEAREEFEKIVEDKSLTIAEARSKMNAWASKQGGAVERDFESAQKEVEEMEKAFDKAVAESSLSNAAKDAFHEMKAILSDENQTEEQQEQEISDYLQTLSEEIRKEVAAFLSNTPTDVVGITEK